MKWKALQDNLCIFAIFYFAGVSMSELKRSRSLVGDNDNPKTERIVALLPDRFENSMSFSIADRCRSLDDKARDRKPIDCPLCQSGSDSNVRSTSLHDERYRFINGSGISFLIASDDSQTTGGTGKQRFSKGEQILSKL